MKDNNTDQNKNLLYHLKKCIFIPMKLFKILIKNYNRLNIIAHNLIIKMQYNLDLINY